MFQITLLYANDDVEKLLSKVKNLFIFCHLAGETGTSLVVALSTLPSQTRAKYFAQVLSQALSKLKMSQQTSQINLVCQNKFISVDLELY